MEEIELSLKHTVHIDHVDKEMIRYRNIGMEDFRRVFDFAHKFYLQEEHLMRANGGEPVAKSSTYKDYVEDMSFGLGVMALSTCNEIIGFAIGASLDNTDGPDPITVVEEDAHTMVCHISEKLLGVDAAFPLARELLADNQAGDDGVDVQRLFVLHHISVHPQHRGRGISKTMTKLLLQVSRREGCEVALAICSSPISLSLLHQLGFHTRRTVDITQYHVPTFGHLFNKADFKHIWIVAAILD